jgi:hypothetical protein
MTPERNLLNDHKIEVLLSYSRCFSYAAQNVRANIFQCDAATLFDTHLRCGDTLFFPTGAGSVRTTHKQEWFNAGIARRKRSHVQFTER